MKTIKIILMMILCATEILLSQYQIPYGVISSGGGKVSGTTNTVTFSLGEPIVGKIAGSTNIAATGFWNVYQKDVLTDVEDEELLPIQYKLEQNYPNPFNPSTIIKFSVPERSNVSIKIFNIVGEEVATLVNEEKDRGWYEVKFNASSLSSGVYFYQLRAGDFIQSKKMILLR